MQQLLEEENLIPGFFAVTQVAHEENHSQTSKLNTRLATQIRGTMHKLPHNSKC